MYNLTHTMYCWLLLQIYPVLLIWGLFLFNNFSNNATVVLEGFRTTFFKSQRAFYSLALIAVASFCAFLSCTNARQTQVHSGCEGLFLFQWKQQSHKESTDNSPLSEDCSVVRVRGTLQLLWVWRQRFIILRRPLPRWLVAGSPAVLLFWNGVLSRFGLSCYRSTALHKL